MGPYTSGYSGGDTGLASLIYGAGKWLWSLLHQPKGPELHASGKILAVRKAPQSTPRLSLAPRVESGYQSSYSGGQSRISSAISNFVNEAQYSIPVWGACQQCSDALNNGEYLASVGYFGLGLLDMFSFGTLTEVRATMNAAAVAERIAVASRGIEAAKQGRVIIGETMIRVETVAAKNSGSVILNDMPVFSGSSYQITSQMMTYNRHWILQQMRNGRPILDIGVDPIRKTPSIFYQMEQNMIKNYQKLHPNSLNIIRP